MAISFQHVTLPPLKDFSALAPDGAVIGIVGADGAGKRALLRAAGRGRLIGPDDPLDLSPVDVLLLDHAFAKHDYLVRAQAAAALERLRRSGATVLLVSHEDELLLQFSDEIWWLREGMLAGRGDPAETLRSYRCEMARRMREWGASVPAELMPRFRRGDGRAQILVIELIGETGTPTTVWRSGELAVIRIGVRFREDVADPVIGILIRTRIGLNVYGTNTELENLKLGPRAAGDTLRLTFAFRCELCPQEYTLTVASHDPDGLWHDWLEEAVMFSVSDERYTAGVANLRTRVNVEP